MLRPLAPADVAKATAAALANGASDVNDDDIGKASAAADGSVARAIALLDGEHLALRERIVDLLSRLPVTDPRALHALGDSLDRAGNDTFATFIDTVRDWLSGRIAHEAPDTVRLAQWAEVWEKLHRTAREVEVFNLERKPMIFAVFGSLAETARR
jgi:DNA polymerase-3 subunit delta'